MGQLTRAQLRTQGMLLAGRSNSALESMVNVGFNAWLRSTYKGWLWPYLNRQAVSIPLAASASALTIGNGSGGITHAIADIFDPIYLYSSDYGVLGRARIRQLRGGPSQAEPSAIQLSRNLGIPMEFKAVPSETVEGTWNLVPYPFPDRALLLSIDYKHQPADLSADANVPRYENDRTMIQAMKVLTLEYNQSDSYQQELGTLATMVAQDFAKDAARTGINDTLGLDPNIFP